MAKKDGRSGRVSLTLDPKELERLIELEPDLAPTTWANAYVRRFIRVRSEGRFVEDIDANERLILEGIRQLASRRDASGAGVIELIGLATRSDEILQELASYRARIAEAIATVRLRPEAGPRAEAAEPRAGGYRSGKEKG
jgi:hypothetical protein